MSLSVKVFGLILLSTWALFLPGNTWAQYTTGGVQGTVLDSSGAVVKDAIVTLHSRETNAVRTFATGADGVYLFAAVPPGYYALTAEASGFAKSIRVHPHNIACQCRRESNVIRRWPGNDSDGSGSCRFELQHDRSATCDDTQCGGSG